jgi:hypothetical protein
VARIRTVIGGPLVLAFVAAAGLQAAGDPQAGQAANPQAVALEQFQDRVKTYLALRDKLKANLSPPKPSKDAGELTERQEALATAVRAARSQARPGEIFVPEVVPILRRTIARDLRRRPPGERAAALKEVPAHLPLKINDDYPKSVALATMPPRLLAEMPRLPDGLEYRFVGRRLILHDTVTNLVVDILDNAMPGQ